MMGHTYVDEIENAVNPVWSGDSSIPSTIIRNITALSSSIAYSADIRENITILSSRYASTSNGVIQGLLYVPDLDAEDPCKALESKYIPQKVVRQNDLPPSDYNLIALVPWYNYNCTKRYMEAATGDPIRGFVTYLPDNSTERPPAVSDVIWDLHDRGAWKSRSKFPVYAVPGSVGASMMTQLGLYSGNVSSVPYGENITNLYNPDADDYVRIWSEIHVTTPNSLPTMWMFILVCVAVFLAAIAFTSCIMHYFQRRRRNSLRGRVISGEVNLEAMNIKRVLVPVEHVEKFPLFTYNYEPKAASWRPSQLGPKTPPPVYRGMSIDEAIESIPAPAYSEKAQATPTARSIVTGITSVSAVTNSSTATDHQPRCMICLDEYQSRVTIIRELPCGHIYHPECIDEYLSQNSSLCPQCKASMLPEGFCPTITNAMVRRERAVRRLRDQVVEEGGTEFQEKKWTNMKRKLFRPSKSASNAVQRVPTHQMQSLTPETRTRMRNLAGGGDDAQSWDGRPTWKRAIRTVFPGFH